MKQKGLRKLVSMILAVVMVFAMSATAFAATITIENTTTSKTYTAYKIFDATGSGSNVSYTIESNSVWYDVVKNAVTEDGDKVFTLIQAGEDSTTYYVIRNSDVSDDEVIAVFESVPDGAVAAATGTGTGRSITLTDSDGETDIDAGYYYITTNVGTAVTIDTTIDSVTVKDKEQTPGENFDKTASDAEVQIGDSVTYTITSGVPAYDGETKITTYTFTDILSVGLNAPAASGVSVKILKADGTEFVTLTNTADVTYITVTENADGTNTIKVEYDPTSIDNYPADATIKIEYTVTVNSDAAYENGNTVTHTWTGDETGKTETETVYTYGFNLQKIDGTTQTELSNAEFKLYTSSTGGTAIQFVKVYDTDGETVIGYKVADSEDTDTTDTIVVGSTTIEGLDADVTYYLEETKAPAGYNMVGGRTRVRVGQTGSYNEEGINNTTTIIENNAGSVLPSTGGMGTTIFYIVGGVLVLGAAVLFVTRKRLGSEN